MSTPGQSNETKGTQPGDMNVMVRRCTLQTHPKARWMGMIHHKESVGTAGKRLRSQGDSGLR